MTSRRCQEDDQLVGSTVVVPASSVRTSCSEGEESAEADAEASVGAGSGTAGGSRSLSEFSSDLNPGSCRSRRVQGMSGGSGAVARAHLDRCLGMDRHEGRARHERCRDPSINFSFAPAFGISSICW